MTTTIEPPATRWSARIDATVIAAVVAVVAAAAWLVLWGTHGRHGGVPTPPAHGGAHGHHGGLPGGGFLTGLAGWSVMVAAMMLPPAVPLLRVLRRLTRRRRNSWGLVTIGAVEFMGVWVAAGAVFVAGSALLGTVHASPRAGLMASGTAVLAAGVYQFTPLKKACLTACRSPRSIAMSAWHGRYPAAEAGQIGLRFGLVCVGCCWALMLLTFAVGVAAMPVMVLMTAVMAAERLLPAVRRFVPAVGVAAIGLGVAILLGVVPAGLMTGV